MNTIYLLRHGETIWNREGRMQGSLDSPLTPKGRVQAARQGAILRGLGIDARAFVSPRGRARSTAALAGLHVDLDERLAEMSMGTWEGRVRPGGAGASGVLWKFAAPGGETQAALIDRLRAFNATLPAESVVVTHGVVCIALRAMAAGLAPTQWDLRDDPQGVVWRIAETGETLLR